MKVLPHRAQKGNMMYCFRHLIALLVLFFIVQTVSQARDARDDVTARCWKQWVDFRMKDVPKAEDTISPATGKEMSQTDGAKRTRALKYQAKLDALELRGKDDPVWHTFLDGCAKRQ
jgi:hypothetical protein